MKLKALIAAAIGIFPLAAHADVEVQAEFIQEYTVPAGFDVNSATIAPGPADSTMLWGTVGDAADIRCSVIVADDASAREFRYGFDSRASACMSVTAHPTDGFFVRTFNPTAQEGDVTGATAYIDSEGREVWKVPDALVVDARPRPQGPGDFLGTYVRPFGPLIYNPEIDRVMAFTLSKLEVGLDDKFLVQAHLINADDGFLGRGGQTFGQPGVGFPAGGVIRDDSRFLLHYFLEESRGGLFYTYDGRNDVGLFEPSGDWENRWVRQIAYEESSVFILWSATNELDAPTRLSRTNDAGELFFDVEFESLYRFRDGEFVQVEPGSRMWPTGEFTVIEHRAQSQFFVRVVDREGESLGLGRVANAVANSPLGIVRSGPTLKLLSFEIFDRRIREYALTFEDVAEFDPDAGIGDMGPEIDVGIGTIGDVLGEVGCSCSSAEGKDSAALVALLLGALALKRRRR